ncbi:MAG: VOC family protein [Planctomycetota bacterium]
MSTYNRDNNCAVWFDIPVADLERSVNFYKAVLATEVSTESFDGFSFAVLMHEKGNGGCLVPMPDAIHRDGGILLYMNVHGRIRDAVAQVTALGGEVLEEVHPIGPHGFRAIIRDSEGNRLALHSEEDS